MGWDSAAVQVNYDIDINTGYKAYTNTFDERVFLPIKAEILNRRLSNLDGSRWVNYDLYAQEEVGQTSLVGVADIIRKTRKLLGLPKRDVALIFNISRPTLDKYLKASDLHANIKDFSRNRVVQVGDVVKKTESVFSQSPGAMAKNYMVNGQSLFGLLCELDIDEAKVLSVCNELAKEMANRPKASPMIDETLASLTKNVGI